MTEHLFEHIRNIGNSPTLEIMQSMQAKVQQGGSVYRFGFGQSPFAPPKELVDSVIENAHRKEYMPVNGFKLLREALADFYEKCDGLQFKPENIVIGAGSKILIYCILKSFKKANIILPAPRWVSYEPQVSLCDHTLINVPTTFDTRWHITASQLEDVCQKHKNDSVPTILILTNPGNPDGLCYHESELQELSRVCQQYNIIIISDEIYSLLKHDGKHHSMAHYYPENTIITTGLSKWAGAGGWRLGTALFPEKMANFLLKTVTGIASETYSSATTPIQLAAANAYQRLDDFTGYLNTQKTILRTIAKYCTQTLTNHNVKLHTPEGGFYLLPDFSNYRDLFKKHGINTSDMMCQRLLDDTGVALLAGNHFGMSPNELTARLAYVNFDGNLAFDHIDELTKKRTPDDFLMQYCSDVVEGIQKINSWLDSLN